MIQLKKRYTFYFSALIWLLTPIYCNADITNPAIFVLTDQTLSEFPHTFDVYGTVNADKAVIFLHGAGGRKNYSAYQLGIKDKRTIYDYSEINEKWLFEKNILFVFPQGQALESTPLLYTWSSHLMDSGQDDMAFLRLLVQHIKSTYGIERISLAGHSNGGMMTNRVWYEDQELFESYISISGPMPRDYIIDNENLETSNTKPHMSVLGTLDSVIQFKTRTGDFNTEDPEYFTDYFAYKRWEEFFCNQEEDMDEQLFNEGNLDVWLSCDNSVVLILVEGGDHDIPSLEEIGGVYMRDLIYTFIELHKE